jgi:hypothetical protein
MMAMMAMMAVMAVMAVWQWIKVAVCGSSVWQQCVAAVCAAVASVSPSVDAAVNNNKWQWQQQWTVAAVSTVDSGSVSSGSGQWQ